MPHLFSSRSPVSAKNPGCKRNTLASVKMKPKEDFYNIRTTIFSDETFENCRNRWNFNVICVLALANRTMRRANRN